MLKKIIIGTIIAFFMFTGIAIAGPGHAYGHNKNNRGWNKHHNHHQYRGYRDRYRGHRYYHPRHYRGHWRSWDNWMRFKRRHHREMRHGRYYKRDGHLYFGFSTPDGFFSFSIGR